MDLYIGSEYAHLMWSCSTQSFRLDRLFRILELTDYFFMLLFELIILGSLPDLSYISPNPFWLSVSSSNYKGLPYLEIRAVLMHIGVRRSIGGPLLEYVIQAQREEVIGNARGSLLFKQHNGQVGEWQRPGLPVTVVLAYAPLFANFGEPCHSTSSERLPCRCLPYDT